MRGIANHPGTHHVAVDQAPTTNLTPSQEFVRRNSSHASHMNHGCLKHLNAGCCRPPRIHDDSWLTRSRPWINSPYAGLHQRSPNSWNFGGHPSLGNSWLSTWLILMDDHGVSMVPAQALGLATPMPSPPLLGTLLRCLWPVPSPTPRPSEAVAQRETTVGLNLAEAQNEGFPKAWPVGTPPLVVVSPTASVTKYAKVIMLPRFPHF